VKHRDFYIGLLRQIAQDIGWERLRALVEELAQETKT
jgi:hypothetical protein